MTEPVEATATESTATEAAPTGDEQSSGRRGRPRPSSTIDRDKQVLTTLGDGPLTRDEIATKLGIAPAQAYLSLHRLRGSGEVQRVREGSQHRWQVAGTTSATSASAESAPVEVAAPAA